MRIHTIIFGSAVVGGALGAIAAVIAFKSDVDASNQLAVDGGKQTPAIKEKGPRVEVAEPTFNFGTMRRGATQSHEFVVKNVGGEPLTLEVGATTCKCTIGVATDNPIAPGESVPVRLEWIANSEPGDFRQTATLITNDTRASQLSLMIEGAVIAAESIEPPELLFGRVTAGASKSAHVFVMSMLEGDFRVQGGELVHPETREFFDLQVEPVALDALPNSDAKAGARVTLTLKESAPLGVLRQSVKLSTNIPEAPTLEVPVVGRIVGDISIHGTSWDDERGILRLGAVKSSEGKVAKLNLVVRGERAADVKLGVASLDPPELRAKVGEARRVSDTVVHVPLEIVVPPGTPPMVRLGTDQGKEGRIVVSTTHATIRELAIVVRFSVER